MNEIKCQKMLSFVLFYSWRCLPLTILDCCWFLLHLHVLLCILQRHNSGKNCSICCFSVLKFTSKVLAFYPLRPQKVSMSHVTESVMEYPRITLCSPAFFTKERSERICCPFFSSLRGQKGSFDLIERISKGNSLEVYIEI